MLFNPSYIIIIQAALVSVYHPVLSYIIYTGESHAVFKVQILEEHNAIEGDLDCNGSPISFVYSPTDEDKAPYLLIHSLDSHLDEIDHNAVLDNIDSTDHVRMCVQHGEH